MGGKNKYYEHACAFPGPPAVSRRKTPWSSGGSRLNRKRWSKILLFLAKRFRRLVINLNETKSASDASKQASSALPEGSWRGGLKSLEHYFISFFLYLFFNFFFLFFFYFFFFVYLFNFCLNFPFFLFFTLMFEPSLIKTVIENKKVFCFCMFVFKLGFCCCR